MEKTTELTTAHAAEIWRKAAKLSKTLNNGNGMIQGLMNSFTVFCTDNDIIVVASPNTLIVSRTKKYRRQIVTSLRGQNTPLLDVVFILSEEPN